MGIKVLLADDSAAIKKVVQLCLQDFGVELKALGNGKDVFDVAKNFKPDISLIDVMLPHKPGFDVAAEMKKDASLKAIPIVMLWSNFMEFDEAKFKASGAEAKLEKPFDAKELRELVKKLVPKTQTQSISQYVEIPKLDFKIPAGDSQTNISSKTSTNTDTSQTNIDLKLNPITTTANTRLIDAKESEPDSSEWVRKDLSKFKVNIDSDGYEENTVAFQYDESQLKNSASIMKATVGTGHGHGETPAPTSTPAAETAAPKVEISIPKIDIPALDLTPPKPAAPDPSPKGLVAEVPAAALDTAQIKTLLEKQVADIVRKEMREILEKAIWKMVPDIATQIIKEEINRLTSES